jgi:hypothetical protein
MNGWVALLGYGATQVSAYSRKILRDVFNGYPVSKKAIYCGVKLGGFAAT